MIDITILTKYTSQGASSRYRYFMYISYLLQQDTNIEIDSFLDTSYLHNLYSKRKKSNIKIIIAYIKRFFVLINSADNLLIEYESLPYVPYFIEKFFLKNKKYILNFDDNVWTNYENQTFLKSKYDNLVKNADGVIVANNFLKDRVSKLNSNLIQIPTVIDLENYNKENEDVKFEKFTLVWIGSPSTYKYIKSHAYIFQAIAKVIDYQLVVIASKELENDSIDGVDMKFYDWSSSQEVSILKKAHIGIMPLDKDPFSQGKSAFKIIQYMASGLPCVASAVGENTNVIKDSKTGFLVDNSDEWLEAIVTLYNDEKLYDDMSNHSKSNAYEYSVQKYIKEFNSFIETTFEAK